MCCVAVCACIRSAELQSSKSPTKGFILSKEKADPDRAKRLIKHPHMSMSGCGNICVMPPKCHAKKEGVVSVTCSVDAAMSGRRCVFLCEL